MTVGQTCALPISDDMDPVWAKLLKLPFFKSASPERQEELYYREREREERESKERERGERERGRGKTDG